MITTATLKNPNVQAQLFAAMRWATIAAVQTEYPVQAGRFNICQHSKGHAVVYIANRKGAHYLRVDYRQGNAKPFTFYACADKQTQHGYDATATVLKSLREA